MAFRGFEMYLFILKEHFELFLYPITKQIIPLTIIIMIVLNFLSAVFDVVFSGARFLFTCSALRCHQMSVKPFFDPSPPMPPRLT